jgi:hypothetical protein
MKKNPAVTMAELKKLGKPQGINVYPLIIGLARKQLGMTKARKSPVRTKTAARSFGRSRTLQPGDRVVLSHTATTVKMEALNTGVAVARGLIAAGQKALEGFEDARRLLGV